MDLFENQEQETFHPPSIQDDLPNINTRWLPEPADDDLKTKIGTSMERTSDTLKKSMNLYWIGLGLICLITILPAILRFIVEFSRWAYDKAGNIFP